MYIYNCLHSTYVEMYIYIEAYVRHRCRVGILLGFAPDDLGLTQYLNFHGPFLPREARMRKYSYQVLEWVKYKYD